MVGMWSTAALMLPSAASTAEAFRDVLLRPRQAALRQILAAHSADAELRDALAEAIDGAIWRRLFLGEPLDDGFARRLAALGRPHERRGGGSA
jgi:hypothetical protein